MTPPATGRVKEMPRKKANFNLTIQLSFDMLIMFFFVTLVSEKSLRLGIEPGSHISTGLP